MLYRKEKIGLLKCVQMDFIFWRVFLYPSKPCQKIKWRAGSFSKRFFLYRFIYSCAGGVNEKEQVRWRYYTKDKQGLAPQIDLLIFCIGAWKGINFGVCFCCLIKPCQNLFCAKARWLFLYLIYAERRNVLAAWIFLNNTEVLFSID